MVATSQVGFCVIIKRLAFCLCCLILAMAPSRAAVYYVTVAGLGGEPEYEQRFTRLAHDLDNTFRASGSDARVFTLTGNASTSTHVRETLSAVAQQARPEDDFVLILIGHGTFDGIEYKFNLVGPDITATELARLCDRIAARRQLIVNTTSASGGSVPFLERPGRAVVAATKTGTEKNATVFARYWVQALHDPQADLDKNDEISALEAFQYAQRKTADFYQSQNRLATEHAVFEDTGKNEAVRGPSAQRGEGLLLSNFILLRVGPAERAADNPATRALLAKKEELERRIATLKYRKAAMSDEEYKAQLTAALIELARVQEALDKK
jgi:hypothetical protein